MLHFFDQIPIGQLPQAGGKGGTLARLYQAGYPVPNGFIILPSAFTGDDLSAGSWDNVQTALTRLRQQGHTTFAVRSSALSEDSAAASFAGEFETVLDVRSDADIRHAIQTVYRSRQTTRVQAYSEAQGMDAAHQMAVIVMPLVAADISGVMFTADPVTGSRMHMPGNYVHGLGEALVSGEVNPLTFTLSRPKFVYDGPPELHRHARTLHRLAIRLENEFGQPQDIEFAIAGGKVVLLQSRPITTLRRYNPTTGKWNDSLSGDYLWTNTNYGEAFPDVMTPATWSIVQTVFEKMMPFTLPGKPPLIGNIGGRVYVNVSAMVSMMMAMGMDRARMDRESKELLGYIPAGLEIPPYPLSRGWAIRNVLPIMLKAQLGLLVSRRKVDAYLAEAPEHMAGLRQQIGAVRTNKALSVLWYEQITPYYGLTWKMVQAATSAFENATRTVSNKLIAQVGEAEANSLLSGLSEQGDRLASLGPLLGLHKVARGEMSRNDYLHQYGHRGPHEAELSIPRPAEDPNWLDQQLAMLAEDGSSDVEELLTRRQAEHDAAWERYAARYPRQAKAMRRQIDQTAAAARIRERVRSEATRLMGVLRTFALRAGEMVGLGEDVFFLSFDEILAVLGGDMAAAKELSARREAYARYSALPPYPPVISGHFDPEQWAADPNRRSDIFDGHSSPDAPPPAKGAITGFAGAVGVVEGVVRVLDAPEDGSQLQPGEILVATTTNIGWTPVFLRTAAVVTDVGAPLSHAAVVARELGIPAVVGCGNATMRLRTGDRVRVDGGQGTVEVIEGAGPG